MTGKHAPHTPYLRVQSQATSHKISLPPSKKVTLRMPEIIIDHASPSGKGDQSISSRRLHSSTAQVFDQIYARGTWGKGPSSGDGSGLGSSVLYARGAKRIVMAVLQAHNLSSMIDAPCGALVWQAPMISEILTKAPNFSYFGVDVASSVIRRNKEKYAGLRPHVRFASADLATTPLPSGYVTRSKPATVSQ